MDAAAERAALEAEELSLKRRRLKLEAAKLEEEEVAIDRLRRTQEAQKAACGELERALTNPPTPLAPRAAALGEHTRAAPPSGKWAGKGLPNELCVCRCGRGSLRARARGEPFCRVIFALVRLLRTSSPLHLNRLFFA